MAQFKIAHGQTKNLPTALEEGQVYVTYDNNGQNGKIFADVEIDGETVRVALEGEQGPQGVSGVYVGSGDMPKGYNIQIDPNGDIGDTAIDIHNEDPLAHADIREEISQLAEEIVDIKSETLQQTPLFANSIDECTDTSKLYVLPDGYFYAYMISTAYPEIAVSEKRGIWYSNNGVATWYVSSSGTVPATKETDYIPVTQGDQLRLTVRGSEGWAANGEWFDANKNPLEIIQGGIANKESTFDITAPEGARYVRIFSFNFDPDENDPYTNVPMSIEWLYCAGATTKQWTNTGHTFVSAEYEDRIISLESKTVVIEQKTIVIEDAITELTNKTVELDEKLSRIEETDTDIPEIIITENANGYWYNHNEVPEFYAKGEGTGVCSKETNYIECKEGDRFKITVRTSSGHEANGGWYDANKNLISIILVEDEKQVPKTTTLTAPQGTVYVRFFSLSWSNDLSTVPLDVVYLGQEGSSSVVATSPLKGKKIVYDGDSICSSWGIATNGGSYPQIIADIVEGTFDNQGVGGGRIRTQEGSSDTFHSIVDNIVNLPTDGDLYCFEGGVNDHWHDTILGTYSKSDYNGEFDKTTFCGALETIFRYATTHFVGKPICYIITHKCPHSAFTKYGTEHTFADFREAALGICEKYSIPVYDAWKDSGINSWNASQLANYFIIDEDTGTGDGTHPNEQGYRRYYVPQLIDLFERIMPIGATEPEEPTTSNILKVVGYTPNNRISASWGTAVIYEGIDLTGQIPVSVGDTIYMKNISIPDTFDSNNKYCNQVGGYKADGTWVFAKNLVGDTIDFNIQSSNGNITQFTVSSDLLGGDTTGFICITALNIDETSIITVNEPIE